MRFCDGGCGAFTKIRAKNVNAGRGSPLIQFRVRVEEEGIRPKVSEKVRDPRCDIDCSAT